MNGTCRLLATTWEWKEDIDQPRAEKAKKHAEEMLAKGGLTDKEYKIAEAKTQACAGAPRRKGVNRKTAGIPGNKIPICRLLHFTDFPRSFYLLFHGLR